MTVSVFKTPPFSYYFPWTMGGHEKKIFEAMDEWSAKTCIQFTTKGSRLHRSVGHGHYIIIKGACEKAGQLKSWQADPCR